MYTTSNINKKKRLKRRSGGGGSDGIKQVNITIYC